MIGKVTVSARAGLRKTIRAWRPIAMLGGLGLAVGLVLLSAGRSAGPPASEPAVSSATGPTAAATFPPGFSEIGSAVLMSGGDPATSPKERQAPALTERLPSWAIAGLALVVAGELLIVGNACVERLKRRRLAS